MISSTPITRRDLLALSIILIVAAVLRLNQIGVVSFQYDEAALSQRAMDMIATHTIPTLGIPSSIGLPNSPATVYVMGIPYAFSDSPIVATAFVALLNVIGVGLLWLLARRYTNPTIAFIAGLVYAVNPWAINYSRKIWAQDFHTPFLLLAMLLGLYGFAEIGNRRYRKLAQALCLPVLLFGMQIHFSAWVLFPLYFWLLWIGRQRISRAALIVSFLLSIVILLPFVIGLSQTFATNPDSLGVLRRNASILGFVPTGDAVIHTAEFATGLGFLQQIGFREDVTNFLAPPAVLWSVIGFASLSGIAGLATPTLRKITMVALLWVLLPIIVFTPNWTPVHDHYFIASIPMLALLAGIGIDFWTHNLQRERQLAVQAAVIGILITQAIWWQNVIMTVDTTLTTGIFATPLHKLMDVRAALQPYKNVLVVSNDYWHDYDQEPLTWAVLLRNSANCVRAIGSNGFAVFPQGPLAVLTTPRAYQHPAGDIYASNNAQLFPLRPGEGSYSIATFDQSPIWPYAPLKQIEPAYFDNGVELYSYYLRKDFLFLGWRLTRGNGENYRYFAHFLDAQGHLLGQVDTDFIPGNYWCAGDRLISWLDIHLPENIQTLRIGIYSTNHPIEQWIDIPFVQF